MELERRGLACARYADDIAIFASSQRSAERILENIGVVSDPGEQLGDPLILFIAPN
jgi:hypothetical protein